MRGDVGVLKRIEKADRRADKASKRLIKKLARSSIGAPPCTTVRATTFLPSSFAPTLAKPNCGHASGLVRVQRQIESARDSSGNRAFLVCELLATEDEEPEALLVIERSALADTKLLERALASKEAASRHLPLRVSHAQTKLLHCDDESLQVGTRATDCVYLSRLRIGEGGLIFYGRDSARGSSTLAPRALGLDAKTFQCAQRLAARLLGARLVS